MASVNYMTQVLFAIGMVSNILNTAVRAIASSERVSEVLEQTPAQKAPERPATQPIRGGICFEDVSFAYADAGKEALSHVTFWASPGETIGIIALRARAKRRWSTWCLGFMTPHPAAS